MPVADETNSSASEHGLECVATISYYTYIIFYLHVFLLTRGKKKIKKKYEGKVPVPDGPYFPSRAKAKRLCATRRVFLSRDNSGKCE